MTRVRPLRRMMNPQPSGTSDGVAELRPAADRAAGRQVVGYHGATGGSPMIRGHDKSCEV